MFYQWINSLNAASLNAGTQRLKNIPQFVALCIIYCASMPVSKNGNKKGEHRCIIQWCHLITVSLTPFLYPSRKQHTWRFKNVEWHLLENVRMPEFQLEEMPLRKREMHQGTSNLSIASPFSITITLNAFPTMHSLLFRTSILVSKRAKKKRLNFSQFC